MYTFEEVFVDDTRNGTKLKSDEYCLEGRHVIIDQGQNNIAGYTNWEEGLYIDVPAIIFGDHTRVVKYVDRPFFLGADGVKVLKCKLEGANYKYLYYMLKNVRLPDTGYNRHFKWLKEIEFSYPQKNTQDAVVIILDKVQGIINLREQEIKELDNLIKSRFVELFGNMTLNPNRWEIISLGKVCDVRDGTHDSPKYYAMGYPLVTSKNVTSGKIDFSECSLICEEDYKKINERSKVDIGDILMPMIGTVGKPVIVDVNREFAIKNVALIKFYEDSKVTNIFVKALLQSDYFDLAVINKIRGGTQKFIALGDIRKLEICLPPMEVQEKFATYVNHIDKLKSEVQKSLDEMQLLMDSLMQKYFG